MAVGPDAPPAHAPLRVVLLGPPGAGKGTQAQLMAREHGLVKISTGDILREAVAHGTRLGRQIQSRIEAGNLVGDSTMVEIVQDRLALEDAKRGYVLDGFPRTTPQARALDAMLDGEAGHLTILLIEVPFEELVRRLQARRVCGRCGRNADPGLAEGIRCSRCGGMYVTRVDDSDGVVRQRLTVYLEETEPLVNYYDGRATFFRINGNLAPDAVTAQVRGALATSRALARRGDVGDGPSTGDARP
jgi:adenylate kinase